MTAEERKAYMKRYRQTHKEGLRVRKNEWNRLYRKGRKRIFDVPIGIKYQRIVNEILLANGIKNG